MAIAGCRGDGLGDRIHRALDRTGITTERVEYLLGRPCGCQEKIERLNRLGAWSSRVLEGKVKGATRYLEQMLE